MIDKHDRGPHTLRMLFYPGDGGLWTCVQHGPACEFTNIIRRATKQPVFVK